MPVPPALVTTAELAVLKALPLTPVYVRTVRVWTLDKQCSLLRGGGGGEEDTTVQIDFFLD